ncbi:unnamed protein product [Closterium sp. NIES-54]
MATLVPTSEEEPTLVVARFCAEIAWAEGGEEVAGPAVAQAVAEAGSLLAANRNADLVSLLLTSAETVLAKGSEKGAKEASAFTIKYLSLFTAAEAAASPAAQQAAAQAAIDFIRTPDAFQSDLLDLPAVHHLASVPEHAPLHALLCVFLKERLPQFHAFVQANPTALETYGLSHDECEAKMRLLSLAALASDSFAAAASAAAAASGAGAAGSVASPTAAAGGSGGAAAAGGGAFAVGEIRYALLQDTLQVAEEEVEQWVVRAIAAKVVDARMDQQRRVVVVTRSTQRVFGLPQWVELRNRLAMWKENISNVSRVAQSARLSGSLGPRGAAAAAAASAASAAAATTTA